MSLVKIVKLNTLRHPDVRAITNRDASPSPVVTETVRNILADVKARGHQAAVQYARQYDGLRQGMAVTKVQLQQAAQKLGLPAKKAIRQAIINVRKFHEQQVEQSWNIKGSEGQVLGQLIRPLRRVGVYVPGGAGAYPSTLIMNSVPAQVAGVKEIVVVTPAPKGIHPSLAYAIMQLGITEVYKIGGAQAVAMLAYGTEKVTRVDKIVGPGNVFSTLAKKEVFGTVDIDMIAGPSEVLILADESSDPDWVAADMLAQAEHGSGYEAAICVTTSAKMAEWVAACVEQQVSESPKKAILEKTLSRFGRIYVVKDWKIGCELADAIAPEHLEIMVKEPKKLLPKIHNAGAIFMGPYSAEAVGDYFAGPNHVLPTNGSARFFSPLGTYDFYKRTGYLSYTGEALRKNGELIAALADSEGFYHHAQSVRKRL